MEKKRSIDPLRLARRNYAIKVAVPVDEPTALAVEAGMREDEFDWPSALEALAARLQHAANEEINALRTVGQELLGDQERAQNKAKVERLRAQLAAAEKKLGLHLDPVMPDEESQPDPPPPPPPGT